MALTKPKLSQNIDTDISVFTDPILVLHQGSASANVDTGFLFNRANGLVSNVAIYWSESANSFVTAFTNSSGAADANVAPTQFANVRVGSVTANTIQSDSYKFSNGAAFVSTTLANTTEITSNLSSGQDVGLSLTATGVAAGNYGSATSIPTVVVDTKGRITSVTSNAVSTTITLAGGSGSGSVAGGSTLTVAGTTNQITTSVSSSTITVALAQDITAPGNLTVAGNLVVQGNTTTLNTETLTVEDLNITVANGAIDAATADGAGLTVGGANARLLYKSATDSWVFDRGVFASGNLVANSNTVSSSVTSGALVVTGGAGISGALYIQNTGDVSANIGTLFTGNNVTNANLGAFQTFSNANAATQAISITSIVTNANANTAAYLLTATGNINAGNITTSGTSGNISGVNYIFAGNYAYANGVSILTGVSGTYSNTNVEAYIGGNIGAFQTFSNANAAAQATGINTINANIGAYQTYANANVVAIQANIGAFYNYANTKIGTNTNSNLVVVSTTPSTSTITGALVVRGGAGIAGNVLADKFYAVNGIYWSGNGASFSSGGGGITYTASTDPPAAGNVAGDQWYNTVNDTLYEYLSDGTTAYWVDIQSPIIVTTGSTGSTTDTLHPFLLAGM
jgi:hypothetical protein